MNEKKLTDEEIVNELKRYRSSLNNCTWGSIPKLLDDTLDIIKRQGAKIGQLKLELSAAYEDRVDICKKLAEQKSEIERLEDKVTDFARMLRKSQKQVDELTDICLDCPYKLKFDEIEKQAVKDTAKEIYQQLQGHGTTYVKKWIKERFGVEVE